jgi:hypothetical protein
MVKRACLNRSQLYVVIDYSNRLQKNVGCIWPFKDKKIKA